VKRVYVYPSAFLIFFGLVYYILNTPFSGVIVIRAPSFRAAYNLTPQQLTELEKKSDNGDSDAALALFWYYEEIKGDNSTAFVWLKRSAALGNKKAPEMLQKLNEPYVNSTNQP